MRIDEMKVLYIVFILFCLLTLIKVGLMLLE